MIYDRYYYSKLNNREKKAYKKIYAAIQNHESSVTINGFIETDIPKLMSAINLDNPHLFYVDFRYGFQSDLFSQTIILKYIYNQADTLILTEKVKKVCNKILSKVAGKTEFEKELSLHDILARNVLYDDVAKDNLLKFHARSNTILGVLFYKTAVCEGIAKTFKFLLNALDIKCIVVKGKATDDLSGNVSSDTLHAWNMVKIDGQPYHVDLTWNISSSDKNMLCHYYFNLSDVDISIDHAISSDLPKCRSNNENYYYKNGLIVENKSDLRGIIYKRIQNGINTVEFKLCGNVFENDTEIMYFVQKSVEVATHLSKSFSVAYTANPQQNIYFFLWTFK